MGWVPTVGIELLLNSWKDYYLGALGKTPSMYVHMYVGKKKNILQQTCQQQIRMIL